MNALNISGTLQKLLSSTQKAAGDLSGGLAHLRTRIAELQGAINETEGIAVSKAAAFKRLDHAARRARAAGVATIPIASFITPEGDGRLPLTPMSPAPSLFDFWVSLHADEIKARLAERIERFYAEQPGIDDTERDKRLEKLEGELADLEVAEERLVRTAERGGLPVLRRADASPLIVLAPDAALEQ